jgi:hypothetical protein
MTQEEFIGVLDEKGYSYKIEGDKLVVTRKGYVDLNSLTSLPPDVEFRNKGDVYLSSLTSLPPGAEFRNKGFVDLELIESIPPDTEFRNEGDVYLESLTDGWFSGWNGNIEGIESNMLLNLMINKEMFI